LGLIHRENYAVLLVSAVTRIEICTLSQCSAP
jgi:hypothetical protein